MFAVFGPLFRPSAGIAIPPLLAVRCSSSAASLELRPYQEDCVKSCIDALNSGCLRIGVSSPTGSGKTVTFISLLSRLQPPAHRPDATRALVIVSSIELAKQAESQTRRMLPCLSVEIEQGQAHIASGKADITIATYQTLRRPDRLKKYDPNLLKAIVVDEAHRAAAQSYLSLLSHFNPSISKSLPTQEFSKPQSPSADVPIIGFSATFSRHDGAPLGQIFERIVFHLDFLELMKQQWLSPVRFTTVGARINLGSVDIDIKTGQFNQRMLAQVMNSPALNKLVVETWKARAGDRQSTLVFCTNVAHIGDLTETFRGVGVDARQLHSKMPMLERTKLLDGFRAGEFPVLVNCEILLEGADLPRTDCILIVRPTQSRELYTQMIGRGMRRSPETGKQDCRIIDFVDTVKHVDGVVSVPQLFGLDPYKTQVDDETPQSLSRLSGSASNLTEEPTLASVEYRDHDDPYSLIHGTTKAQHITGLSKNAWVACGDEKYVLELRKHGRIKVLRKGATYEGWFVPKAHRVPNPWKWNSLSKPCFIGRSNDLGGIIPTCDAHATKLCDKYEDQSLRQSATWRRAPASDKQKSTIARELGIQEPKTALVINPAFVNGIRGAEKTIRFDNLTKGEANTYFVWLAQSNFSRSKMYQGRLDPPMQQPVDGTAGLSV